MKTVLTRRRRLRAGLKMRNAAAAGSFGGCQGGSASVSPQRAVLVEPTQADAKRTAEGLFPIFRQALMLRPLPRVKLRRLRLLSKRSNTDMHIHAHLGKHLKPRPDNILMNLPADQREKLNRWLTEHSYAKVQALLALAIPEGMGLRTHTTSIGRYYKRVMPAYLNPDRKDPDALIREIAATPDFTGTFDNATVTELKRRMYYAASNPTTRVPDLVRTCKFVLPLRRTTP